MASLTDPKVTSYSTVTSIDVDLVAAEKAYDDLQTELETLLESGKATMAAVAEVEERIAKAMYWRDELQGTRDFLVDRQRWQAEKDAEGLLYAIALCKWSDGFTAANVTAYTTSLYTANEMNGVTGAIYVLRGWFALYLEGPPSTINRMCAELKADRGQFEIVVIAEKDSIKAVPSAATAPLRITSSSSAPVPDKDFNARASLAIVQFEDDKKAQQLQPHRGNTVSSGPSVADPNAPRRKYPNESLRIVHVDDGPQADQSATAHQKHPETVVLREVSYMMNLFSFVPQFNAANRGKGRFESSKGTNLLVTNDPTSMAIGGAGYQAVLSHDGMAANNNELPTSFPMASRAVALISPFGDFWEMGLPEKDVSRIIRAITDKAQTFLVDREQRSFAAGLAGPHTQDGLYVVIDSNNMGYTIELMTDFLAELNRDLEIFELYKPMLVLEHSLDVGLIVNGSCTIVGPIMRQLRKLMTVARQEVCPFLTSYRVADLANRSGCHSVGVFVIDKDPSELFTHVTQLGKIGVYAGAEAVALISAKADAAQRAVDEHVEGPGAIEPYEDFGIRTANDKEKKDLHASNARARRASNFEAKSAAAFGGVLNNTTFSPFSTGTMDAPRPPANLTSTKAVLAALHDPSRHAAVKSIEEMTTEFRKHRVMKDDPSVRPAGSALQAVRSGALSSPSKRASTTTMGTVSAAEAGLSRGAHAARIVQSVSYFTPKGIQGDEEFRAIYDALPTEWGGPAIDAGPCVTRRGFDAYYYSLEHYGTDPTPSMVDSLLGRTNYPNFVTFEQFCVVMNKYQKM